ncbi:MAG TPA: outer membrane beta-barrel protein [Longimicrobium sp.]|jgi:opacity protein-like surface antigen|uniref:outer membrane beta-barrel protein n=1 Tax=Longimicrobium sp. TaxID=2029185 RepID=UPI002EDAA3BD
MRHIIIRSALLAAAVLSAPRAVAQVSDNSGLLLNLNAAGAVLNTESQGVKSRETGTGFGFLLGYGFNERIALYLAVDALQVRYDGGREIEELDGEYVVGQLDIGLRYTFLGAGSALRPYVSAAIASTGVADEFADEEGGEPFVASAGGSGFSVGAGLQYFVSRRLAVELAVQESITSLSEFEKDGEAIDPAGAGSDLTVARLKLGVTWHP